ncbi:MAG: serine/threonine protein kinase [bacterium]
MNTNQPNTDCLRIKNYVVGRKICRKMVFTLFEAVKDQDDQKRFLKILNKDLSSNEDIALKFLRTASLASQLEHDDICKVYHYGLENGYYIIESEEVCLKPLSLRIHEEFPFPVERIVAILVQISQVLRKAHYLGIVHGILNPGSIYFGDNSRIKIDDFGFHWIASYLSNIDESEARYLSRFIAPEFFNRDAAVDGRADIYSLGVLLMHLLMDRMPTNGIGPSIKSPDIVSPRLRQCYPHHSEALENILQRCLHQNSEKRFFKLSEFIEDLEALAERVTEDPVVQSKEQMVKANH